MMIFAKAIGQGLALGLFLAIQLGPSLFALIQTGSKKGFKPGLGLAFGILISDIIYVILSYLGIAQLFDNPESKQQIGFAGGVILIIFGLMSIFQKKESKKEMADINEVSVPLYIVKGFFLNFLNPAVFLLWILYVGVVSSDKDFTQMHIAIFFMVTLSTVFVADTLKAYYANKISKYLSDKVLHFFNILLGLILFITGLMFLYNALFPS
jgi:threonine/homoserine/homoserine lactone efflux protein